MTRADFPGAMTTSPISRWRERVATMFLRLWRWDNAAAEFACGLALILYSLASAAATSEEVFRPAMSGLVTLLNAAHIPHARALLELSGATIGAAQVIALLHHRSRRARVWAMHLTSLYLSMLILGSVMIRFDPLMMFVLVFLGVDLWGMAKLLRCPPIT